MTEALHRKFVTTAMIAVTVLLAAIVCAIGAVNAYLELSEAGRIAEMLADNGGVPDYADEGEPERSPALPGRIGEISEDSARSARFFLVTFNSDGAIVKADTSSISSVNASEARETARSIYDGLDAADGAGRDRTGLKNGMLYCVSSRSEPAGLPEENSGQPAEGRTGPDGSRSETTVVCLDISERVRSVISVFLISLAIGAAAWILMLFLVIALSRRAIAPIAENISRQRQFVTDAGHEIKTPLAIIIANTDALELHAGESKWTRNIRSQTKRLSGLMQNLLTLSRMDEPQLKLPMTDFDLGQAAKEGLVQFAEPAQAKGIVLTTEIDSVTVHANRESIQQLISILADNAVRYTPEGGTVCMSVRKEGKYAVLEESNPVDPLLGEPDPERLFDRFYRGDKARTQKGSGYGIGLSAARAIARMNKGTVNAVYRGQDTIVFILRLMV